MIARLNHPASRWRGGGVLPILFNGDRRKKFGMLSTRIIGRMRQGPEEQSETNQIIVLSWLDDYD